MSITPAHPPRDRLEPLTPEPAGADAPPTDGGGSWGDGDDPALGGRRGGAGRSTKGSAFLGLLPFVAFTVLFLGIPTVAVALGAFRSPTGAFTLDNVRIASRGTYFHGFVLSVKLAVLASVIPAIAGVLLANAVLSARRGVLLRRLVSTASGVFANFGGVPLAFVFIATLGNTGIATVWLKDVGLNPYDHGFNLYTFSGIVVVYLYFQVPLMVLVITPALEGLRPAWREAAENLGARSWQYWRYVGGPVLLPSVLGSTLLLFGSSLSAYATAEALTSGSIALTSIQIGTFLNGNVVAGHQNVGKALGLGLVLVISGVIVIYVFLQRRASRWLR